MNDINKKLNLCCFFSSLWHRATEILYTTSVEKQKQTDKPTKSYCFQNDADY